MCIQHDPFDLLDGPSPLAENTTLGARASRRPRSTDRSDFETPGRPGGCHDRCGTIRVRWGQYPRISAPFAVSRVRPAPGAMRRLGRAIDVADAALATGNRGRGERPAGSRSAGWPCRPQPIRWRAARPARRAAASLRVRCVGRRQAPCLIRLEMFVSGRFIGCIGPRIVIFARYEIPM